MSVYVTLSENAGELGWFNVSAPDSQSTVPGLNSGITPNCGGHIDSDPPTVG